MVVVVVVVAAVVVVVVVVEAAAAAAGGEEEPVVMMIIIIVIVIVIVRVIVIVIVIVLVTECNCCKGRMLPEVIVMNNSPNTKGKPYVNSADPCLPRRFSRPCQLPPLPSAKEAAASWSPMASWSVSI